MGETVRQHIRRHIVGYLALFVALSGTAYSAGKIGSKDIKRGAVKSKHVKDSGLEGGDILDQSLTGADINQSTLFNDNSLTGGDINEGTLNVTSVNGVTAQEIFGSAPTGATPKIIDENGFLVILQCGAAGEVGVQTTIAPGGAFATSRGRVAGVAERPSGDLPSTDGFGQDDSPTGLFGPGGGVVAYRTPGGQTYTFNFVSEELTNGFGTTDDCFVWGHLLKS